jgi:upstream activation factor subunit UAF30
VLLHAESSEDESSDGEQEQDDEDDNEPPKRRKTGASKPTPSKKARKSSDGASPRVNGFTKPVKLSPQLAAFMGSETAPRPQITKKLWEYVKERGLQDPSNKQFILADETLRELTGENRFQAFSFSKLIKEHILGYA